MEPIYYNETDIDYFKVKYKWQKFFYLLCTIMIFTLSPIIKYLLPAWSNSYGYYDIDNVYHYIYEINDLISIVLFLSCAIPLLFLLNFVFKKILKEKYTEFIFAQSGINLKQSRLTKIVSAVSAGVLLIVFIVVYNNLTFINLSNDNIYIKCHRYSVSLDNTYSYDSFEKIQLMSSSDHSNSLYFTMKTINKIVKTNTIHIDLGQRTQNQSDFLKAFDEKTNNKYNLMKASDFFSEGLND